MADRKWSEELDQLAVKIYNETHSGNVVAKRLGVSSTTAHRHLVRLGVAMPGWTDPKPHKLKTQDALVPALVAEYDDGRTWKELEAKYGIGQWSMREALRRNGVKIKPRGGRTRKTTPETEQEICRLYEDETFSQMQIASQLGVSQILVSRVLKRCGVEVRNNSQRGENHHAWRGGKIEVGGYIRVYVASDDPFAGMRDRIGYVAEHRLEMSKYLGRALTEHETVHHIDGDRGHNHISNLQLRIGKHGASSAYACADCGSTRLNPVHLK